MSKYVTITYSRRTPQAKMQRIISEALPYPSPPPPPPAGPYYLISGTITDNGTGFSAGVEFTSLGTIFSATSGSYGLLVAEGYGGTATPHYANGDFVPQVRTYGSVVADTPNQDYAFTAYPLPIVSGEVRLEGVPTSGISVSFSGDGQATSNVSGTYSQALVYNYTGTATPVGYSAPAYLVTPTVRTYASLQSDQAGQDFDIEVQIWTIEGSISSNGTGIATEITNGIATWNSAADGSYSYQVVGGFSGTTQPTYISNPSNRVYTSVQTDYLNQDFDIPIPPLTYAPTSLAWLGWAYTDPALWRVEVSATGSTAWTLYDYTNGTIATYNVTTGTGSYYRITGADSGSNSITPVSNVVYAEPALPSVITLYGSVFDGSYGTGFAANLFVESIGTISSNGGGVWSQAVTAPYTGYAAPVDVSGGTYNPAYRSYLAANTDQFNQDFAFYGSVPPTLSLSGSVFDGNYGTGFSANLFVSGVGTLATDGAGLWSQVVASPYTGYVTPVDVSGGTYDPTYRSYAGVSVNQTNQDFAFYGSVPAPATVLIKGALTSVGPPLPTGVGVEITSYGTVVTDSGGTYVGTVASGYTGDVIPHYTGGTFDPELRSYAGIVTNQTGQDFVFYGTTDDFIFLNSEVVTGLDNGGVPISATFAGSFMWILDDQNVVWTSIDGINWSSVGSPTSTMNALVLGGVFVAVGTQGALETSADAVTWTPQASSTSVDLLAGVYGPELGTYVVVGANGVVTTSTDLSTWTPTTAGTQSFNDVAWGATPGVFVAVGNGNAIFASPDGFVWSAQSSPSAGNFKAVTYSPSMTLFVAVSDTGKIITSSDGSDWTQRADEAVIFKGVANGFATRFAAVTQQQTIYTSADGTTWAPEISDPYALNDRTIYHYFQVNSFVVFEEYAACSVPTALSKITIPVSPSNPSRNVIDPENNLLWVIDESNDGAYYLDVVNSVYAGSVSVNSEFGSPCIAYDPTNKKVLVTTYFGSLAFINPITKQVTYSNFVQQSPGFHMLAVDQYGTAYVCSSTNQTNGSLYVVDCAAETLLASYHLGKSGVSAQSICWAENIDRLVINQAGFGLNRFWLFDPTTGVFAASVITSATTFNYENYYVKGTGEVLISASGATPIEVLNISAGTAATATAIPSDPVEGQPYRIADATEDTCNNTLYVSEGDYGIYKFSMDGGSLTSINAFSNNGVGINATGLAHSRATNLVYYESWSDGTVYTVPVFTIKGQVTSDGTGIASAPVEFTDYGTIAADANGTYQFTVPIHWSGTVTPHVLQGTTVPLERVYTNVLSSYTNQDFEWFFGGYLFLTEGASGIVWSSLPADAVVVDGTIVQLHGDSYVYTSTVGLSGWTLRGFAQDCGRIAYSADLNRYIGAGSAGAIWEAEDLSVWYSRASGVGANALTGLTYGGDRFVAVGESGVTTMSTDGTNWTASTAGTLQFSDVYYNGSLFVAVGVESLGQVTCYTSANGTAWTHQAAPAYTWRCGVYSPELGLNVIIGEAGAIATSPDAVTWTDYTGAVATAEYLAGIAWGNNRFVITDGAGGVWTSSNGTVWDYVTDDPYNRIGRWAKYWQGDWFLILENFPPT